MGLTLEEAVRIAHRGIPHKIAGRCSVFCKSDCTHALNIGEPRENIAAGLCVMMADKLADLVKDMQFRRVAIIGGGSLNSAMVSILRRRLGKLEIPRNGAVFEAYGAAMWAAQNRCAPLPDSLEAVFTGGRRIFDIHPALEKARQFVEFKTQPRGMLSNGESCILGLDVGSTTTKAVLMKIADKSIVASVYLRTNGNPLEASKQCYAAIAEQLRGTEASIIGMGVTGSGRQIAALHALTPHVINEIIAHAAAAAHFDPQVDTIFEIGGQDAEIHVLNGRRSVGLRHE